jgi:two-component system cell cycle sensor histidine kinase PleC
VGSDSAISTAPVTAPDVVPGEPTSPAVGDRWHWLLQESPAPMLVTDGERVLFANRAAARTLHYANAEALAGATMWDLNVAEDYALVRARMAQLRAGQEVPTREARLICGDGVVKRFEVAGYPIDYGGQPAVFVRLTDVTAQRQRESAERETRERLTLAIDMIGGATWIFDYETGQIAECAGVMRMLGYPPHTSVDGRSVIELVHPDDRPVVQGRLHPSRLQGRTEVSTEHRLQRSDGTYIWVRSRARIMIDHTGAPVRALGIDTDITDEKRERFLRDGRAAALSAMAGGAPLEPVMREIVRTAEQALDGSVAAILIAEEETLRLVSGPNLPPALAEMLSLQPIDPQGSCPARAAAMGGRVVNSDLGAAAQAHSPLAEDLRTAGLRSAWMEPVVSVREEVLGVLALYLPQARAPNASDEMVLRELSDVARLAIEHNRTQAHLRAARVEAERANRAKSHFLATMSHELRTPLNAVIGFAEVMQHGVFGPIGNRRYETYVRDILQSARHLLDILSDILDMSRIEAGRWDIELETLGVHDIEAFEHLLIAVAEQHGCTLEIALDPALRLRADKRALKQILINLTSNAARYGSDGTAIRLDGRTNDAGTVLEIADEGEGIPPEQIETLLQPFERSDRAKAREQGGIGLGLPIVRHLCELQGARFELSSEPGVGTTARVVFAAG